jgi:hypothetical protein
MALLIDLKILEYERLQDSARKAVEQEIGSPQWSKNVLSPDLLLHRSNALFRA